MGPGDLVFNVASSQAVNYPISVNASSVQGGYGNLVKTGPGTLAINNTVTFGGVDNSGINVSLGIVSIHQGVMQVNSGGMLTNTSEIDVGDTAGLTGALTLNDGTARAVDKRQLL